MKLRLLVGTAMLSGVYSHAYAEDPLVIRQAWYQIYSELDGDSTSFKQHDCFNVAKTYCQDVIANKKFLTPSKDRYLGLLAVQLNGEVVRKLCSISLDDTNRACTNDKDGKTQVQFWDSAAAGWQDAVEGQEEMKKQIIAAPLLAGMSAHANAASDANTCKIKLNTVQTSLTNVIDANKNLHEFFPSLTYMGSGSLSNMRPADAKRMHDLHQSVIFALQSQLEAEDEFDKAGCIPDENRASIAKGREATVGFLAKVKYMMEVGDRQTHYRE